MANSSDKRDEGGAPAGAGWGKKDIAKGATLVDPETTGARTKGAFGAGTAPPPAGGEEDNAVATLFQDKAPSVGVAPPLPAGTPEPPPAAGDDPVGALFAPGSALPSPAMDDNPSNAEISRWEATNEGSLFDDRVKDPMPGEGAEPAATAVQTASVAAVGSLHPEAGADRTPDDELIAADDLVTDAAPNGAPGPPARQPAPPAQRADGPTIDPAAPGGVGVVIKPAPPVAPPPAAAPPPPAEAPEGYDVQEPPPPPVPATPGKRRGK
ncbi:MAG: hypothetical protein OXT09_15535, partial [Myxococcales bacterium]|nr:hypothetical protein [Myxococcales bacterium]